MPRRPSRAAGIPSPRLDAELLVGHAFGRDRAWLYAHPDAELGASEATLLAGWIERRSAGEPIAYIRGFKEWLSLRIATDARALIPRPETELLVEAAVNEIARRLVRDGATTTAWEVATGSGAVALALACDSEPRSRLAGCGWRPATSPPTRWSLLRRTCRRTGSEER